MSTIHKPKKNRFIRKGDLVKTKKRFPLIQVDEGTVGKVIGLDSYSRDSVVTIEFTKVIVQTALIESYDLEVI